MNKNIEEYLKYAYYSGSDLNDIYTILAKLNQKGKDYEWLNASLINEQSAIKNDYISSNGAYTFLFESWLGLNVQGDKNHTEFVNDVKNKSTKIYVSLDKNKVKKITNDIFKFLSDNNIECQSKIDNKLRTDALTIRVCNKEDVSKVVDFINSMNYTPDVFPNPFLINVGKVSIARDGGTTSYNQILADYINDYFYYNMNYNDNHNDWKEVNCAEFVKFLERELSNIDKNKNPDLYMVTDLICRNVKGTLTLEDIMNYGEIKEKSTLYSYNQNNEKAKNIDKSEEYITLISRLSNYYDSNREYMIEERKEIFDSGIDYAHAVIDLYMKTGNIEFFTRKGGNIRGFVQENFDVYTMKTTVNNIGWNSIIEATKETIQKYQTTANIAGTSNEKGIIERILRGEETLENGKSVFSMFTNNNNVRSRLGYLVSPSMVRDIFINKLNIEQYNYNPTYDEFEKNISEITNIVLEEASLHKEKAR